MSTPDGLTLARHRDLVGRRGAIWVRRSALALLALVALLGALNVFGQKPETTTAETAGAKLSLYAPSRLRGGLIYEARFHVTARTDLKKATLVLDQGWAEGQSINTIEPSPIGETSVDGKLGFMLGDIPAGRSHVLYMQFQVNPTNVGHRSTGVSLYAGKRELLRIDHATTFFP